MSRFIKNAVASVTNPSLVVILIANEQSGWCQQYAEEGYDVVHISYPLTGEDLFAKHIADAQAACQKHRASPTPWAVISFGIQEEDWRTFTQEFHAAGELKAIVHYCSKTQEGGKMLVKDSNGQYIPTLVHLSNTQETLSASLIAAANSDNTDTANVMLMHPPVTVYTYPQVSADPPFPFSQKAPALVSPGEKSSTDPYTRSAVSLSYSRTLELLRRRIGPYFELEKLWEKHTYYEFVERDSRKTMATMVATPYVNHISTLTGGVGHDDLARFYKYHFTQENVTPPDTELITISRTVGADRIVDEMIFKCTHTTEIDYFLPGVKPTGKPLELAVVGIVAFRGDKLTFEHIYWDQASALVQLGLLDPKGLPVAGVDATRKVLDPFGLESNKLMAKWKESEGLPI